MARQSLTEAKRFSIVPSGNFSNPTILSPPPPPPSFFRESREQSRSHTSPIPPSPSPSHLFEQASSSNLRPRASPLFVPLSKRGACAGKRREASAWCRGRRTNVVGQPTDRLDRAFSSRPGQYQAGSRREG